MQENCDSCRAEYTIGPETSVLNMFIDDPQCNHIEAHCPCGATEVIYLTAMTLLHVKQECQLGITLFPQATDELRARAARMWDSQSDGPEAPVLAADALPEVPREWLMELYDDLRNWNGDML